MCHTRCRLGQHDLRQLLRRAGNAMMMCTVLTLHEAESYLLFRLHLDVQQDLEKYQF
jgi:hypothetical protein